MKRSLNIAFALVAIGIVAVSTSLAHGYDWRQKISYGNDPTKGYSSTARTYVARPQVESRRAYSYEPTATASFKAGDSLVVTAANAQMRIEDRVVATVPQGQRITVLRVDGTWVGTSIEQKGQQIGGWILASDLSGDTVSSPSRGCR